MMHFLKTAILLTGLAAGWGAAHAQPKPAVTPEAIEAASQLRPDDFPIGKEDAPVTVIEYASLTCPHCAHFYKDTLPELEKKYIETGKVRFIYREYPLNEPALKAAMVARCAGKDKYHTFTKVLFSTQDKWAFNNNFREPLEKIALLGGMTKEAFAACIADKAVEKQILEIMKSGADAGIQSTPSFIINGTVQPGARDLASMSAIIDPLIAVKEGKPEEKKGDEKKPEETNVEEKKEEKKDSEKKEDTTKPESKDKELPESTE
ncbi:MAG: DsbA family protein [Alphaproteobacteria bacterium]|nr:DsbA family protein [Alphaproteobacteria bacterium]